VTTIPDLGWCYWTAMAILLAAGLSGRSTGLWLAPRNRWQPLTLALGRRTSTHLSSHRIVPPCGDIFRRMPLERVHG
jgi:hypothetical protein